MSFASDRISIDVTDSPSGARLVPGNLAGYAQARQELREQQWRGQGLAPVAKALDSAAQALDEARDGLQGALVESAVQLALEIAQELVRKELSLGNYDIPAIVREVLSSTSSSSGSLVVRVNPEDADSLSEVRFRSGTEIESDPGVRRGDVQLKTDQGLLVRDMDGCLRAIRENLQEAFRSC